MRSTVDAHWILCVEADSCFPLLLSTRVVWPSVHTRLILVGKDKQGFIYQGLHFTVQDPDLTILDGVFVCMFPFCIKMIIEKQMTTP